MNIGGEKLSGKWRILLSMQHKKDNEEIGRQLLKHYAERMWRGLKLSRQFVSAALNELEEDGCVKKIVSKDSRKKCYEMTDFGFEVYKNLSQFNELLKQMEEHKKWQEQKNQETKNQENQI